jgi:Bacterial Ig domain
MAHGYYIGRVGALAVALGVGVGLAGVPATAWADKSSGSTSSPSGSSAGASSSPSHGPGTRASTTNSEGAPTSGRTTRGTRDSAASASRDDDNGDNDTGTSRRGVHPEAQKNPTRRGAAAQTPAGEGGSGADAANSEASSTADASSSDANTRTPTETAAAGPSEPAPDETTPVEHGQAEQDTDTVVPAEEPVAVPEVAVTDPATGETDPGQADTDDGAGVDDPGLVPVPPIAPGVVAPSSGSGSSDRDTNAIESPEGNGRDETNPTENTADGADDRTVESAAPEDSTTSVSASSSERAEVRQTTILAAAATPNTGAVTPAAARTPSVVEQLLAIPATLFVATVQAVVAAFEPVVGPGGPLENALLWGILAWTRRQANVTFANRSPDIGVDTINLTVAAGSTNNPIGVLPTTDGDGDTLTYSIDPAHGPSNGTVTITGTTVTYTPNAGYTGTDSFTLIASDANNGFRLYALGHGPTDSATVNIGVNQQAHIVESIVSVPGGGAPSERNTWRLAVNTADASGDVLYFSVSASNPRLQITQLPSGQFLVVAEEQWAAQNPGDQVVVTVTVTNALGATVEAADITIGTINNANIIGQNWLSPQWIPALPAGVIYTDAYATDGYYVLVRSDGASLSFPGSLDSVTIGHVAIGPDPTVWLLSDGTAVMTDAPRNYPAIPELPTGTIYFDASVGAAHTVLLRSDGAVISIGDDTRGQQAIPELPTGATYTSAGAGSGNTILLRSDGTAIAVGDNSYGQSDIPELPNGLTYTRIVYAGQRTVLLRSDGRAVAFGSNTFGQNDIPELPAGMTYTDAAANNDRTVLLRSDGTVVAIGSDSRGQNDIPAAPTGTAYTHVAAGSWFTVLLTSKAAALENL